MIETHLDLIMCFDRGQNFFQHLWKPNGKLLKLLDFSYLSVDKRFQEKKYEIFLRGTPIFEAGHRPKMTTHDFQ